MTKANPNKKNKEKKNLYRALYGARVGSIVKLRREIEFFNPASFLPKDSLGLVIQTDRFGKIFSLMLKTGEKKILYLGDYEVVVCD